MGNRLITGIAAALLAGIGGGAAAKRREPCPPADLNPDRASSGNKARLLERYQRRQARIAKRSGDHG